VRAILDSNKVLLIILDGWGLSPLDFGNAPFLANTPTLDYVYNTYPKTSLAASGLEVGLSLGEVGNSETGHLNIGTGRVVWEDLPRIARSINSNEFFSNPALMQALDNVQKNNSVLHLIGMVSDGGVHSHIDHLLALIKSASEKHIQNVCVHVITDGVDTDPKQAERFVNILEQAFAKYRIGRIATITGRFFAMDRDGNFERTNRAFDLFVNNIGQNYSTANQAILSDYQYDRSDETIEPAVIGAGATIQDNDSVIFFNFRSDRMRQISDMFLAPNNIERVPKNLFICTMMQYRDDQVAATLFPPVNLANSLAEIVAANNLSQLHVAETDKYPYITYYLNAKREQPFLGERDFRVPGKQVNTYDLAPAMSADEVATTIISGMSAGFDLIVTNFANGDAVGHTGFLPATIKACEAVDTALLKVFQSANATGYDVILVGDHGNCESMIDESTGKPDGNHTANPVPFVYLNFAKKPFEFQSSTLTKEDYFLFASGTPIGVLADVAPSVLARLGLAQPEDMMGMDLTIAMG